jgi:N-acetylglutamate synthase-like GNAT family acetyltransferase
MNIKKLSQADFPQVCKILSGYDLPMEDLHNSSLEYFWVAEDKNQVIGVCGIDYSNHVGLVRSLAV